MQAPIRTSVAATELQYAKLNVLVAKTRCADMCQKTNSIYTQHAVSSVTVYLFLISGSL